MLRLIPLTAFLATIALPVCAHARLMVAPTESTTGPEFIVSYSSIAQSGNVQVPTSDRTSSTKVRIPLDKSTFDVRHPTWFVKAEPVQFTVDTQDVNGEDVSLHISLMFDDFAFRLDNRFTQKFALEPCGDLFCTQGADDGRVWGFSVGGNYQIDGHTETESGDFKVRMLPTYHLPTFQLDLSGKRPTPRRGNSTWPIVLTSTMSYAGETLFDGTIDGANFELSLASLAEDSWTTEIVYRGPEPNSISILLMGTFMLTALAPRIRRRDCHSR